MKYATFFAKGDDIKSKYSTLFVFNLLGTS